VIESDFWHEAYVSLICLYAYSVAADEDRKWRHVVNGVVSSPPSHVTSGMDSATSAAAGLWTPADCPSAPVGSPESGLGGDSPLNLTVSRTTSRRLGSPPSRSPDSRTAAGGVGVFRRRAEDSPVSSPPPPAHNPYNAAKSENQTLRKTPIPNNEVLLTKYGTHRNTPVIRPHFQFHGRTFISSRAFRISAPKIWNSLPAPILQS